MLSIRGRIANKIVRKFMNFNPEENKDVLKKMKSNSIDMKFKTPKGYTLDKYDLGNLPLEVFKKQGESNKKAVYLLHGGGYVLGLSNLYRKLAHKYSYYGGNIDVVILDYKLAPAHTFPAALEDALKGWEWMIKNVYKEEDILIVGDSAGGNLSLALMLKLKEMKRKLPVAAVLISPWGDMTASGKSYFENYNKDVMFGGKGKAKAEMVEKILNSPIYSYCGDHNRKDPLLSPIFGDFEGFPPVLITVGSHEILMSDSITIAEKIKKAGGDVTLHIGEGMFHVYPLMDNLIPESKRAMKEILEFIKKHLRINQVFMEK